MDRNKKIGILALLLALIAAGLLNCSGGDDSYDPNSNYSYSTNPCLSERIAAEDSCVAQSCSNCAGFACLYCWASCSNQAESVYQSCCQTHDCSGGETPTEPASTYSYSVSGWIKTEDGTGVPYATILLDAVVKRTNMEGYYKFDNIRYGTLTPGKSGYCFVPENRHYPTAYQPTEYTNQSFTALPSCFSTSGTILSQAGTPLPGITVELSGDTTTSTSTDGNGNYIITNLKNGSYTVTPIQIIATPLSRSVSISDANVTDQDFVFTGRAISGRITTVAGTAVPDVNVTLSGAASSSSTTDSNGYYIFPGLNNSGSYTITLSQDCSAYTFDKPFITVDLLGVDIPGQDFVVSVAPLDISGAITANGTPLSNVMVTLSGTGSTSTMTDASGVYAFPAVQGNLSYKVTPSASGYAFMPAEREIRVCNLEGSDQNFSGTTTWVKKFDNFITYSLDMTSDGGTIMAGYYRYPWPERYDLMVLKLDSNGNVLWQKTYGGTDFDEAKFIRETSDGGFIVTGTLTYNPWVIKLDSSGNMLWQKTYSERYVGDQENSIQETSDGGFIMVGRTSSFGASNYDAWMLKLDNDGNVLWQKRYGGANFDEAKSIQETSDGNFIVAGSTFFLGAYDAWVFKIDNDGNLIWQKTFGGAGNESANFIHETSDGNLIMAGYTYLGAGERDLWMLNLNSDGNILWQKAYGSAKFDSVNSTRETSDGGFIIAGMLNSEHRPWILKLDGSGNILWEKKYDFTTLFTGLEKYSSDSIREISGGGYFISGTVVSEVTRVGTILLRTDSNGNLDACGTVVGTTNATVTNTNVSPVNSTATATDTLATITNTAVVPQDSSVTAIQMCPSM